MAMIGGNKLSREEMRRQRDLNEARKAGTAPPERDSTGKQINPHIPEFMAKAPWYLSSGEPGLQHHKATNKLLEQFDHSADKLKDRYQRGKTGPAATRYRAGACTNCGAMTHTAKDCLERPRKLGAKWTNKDIAADEVVYAERAENYDSKRDRWDGYDPASHKAVVEEHEALEAARQQLREEAVDKATDIKAVAKVAKAGKKKKKDDDFGSSDESDDDDDDKYADGADVAGQKLDTKNRVTVRNLRIREDTAKYLRNLDVESAYYDPKSRSMREAPDPTMNPEDAVFAGDAFQRGSGEAQGAEAIQLFAWQAEQRGQNVHMHANPTQAAMVHKEFLAKKQELKGKSAHSMLEKYGGKEHLQKLPKELLAGQSEDYVEYSRTGEVIKGQERAKAKSKYDEDVYPGNHTSIWGSYYKNGSWGYACCHAFMRAAYCAGQAGIEAEREEAAGRLLTGRASTSAAPIEDDRSRSLMDQHDPKGKRKAIEGAGDDEPATKRRYGEGDVDKRLDGEKLRAAMEAERKRIKRGEGDDKGKGFNSLEHKEVTEEEVEAYRRLREIDEDPMSKLKDDELLPL